MIIYLEKDIYRYMKIMRNSNIFIEYNKYTSEQQYISMKNNNIKKI